MLETGRVELEKSLNDLTDRADRFFSDEQGGL